MKIEEELRELEIRERYKYIADDKYGFPILIDTISERGISNFEDYLFYEKAHSYHFWLLRMGLRKKVYLGEYKPVGSASLNRFYLFRCWKCRKFLVGQWDKKMWALACTDCRVYN